MKNRKANRGFRQVHKGEKMLQILKAEIEYFWIHLLIIVLLLLSFTLFELNNIAFLSDIYLFKKYFWSMVIGLGTYFIVYVIWVVRKKELRDRSTIILPLNINQLSIVRWLFGITPFVFIFLYLEMNRFIIPEQQAIFIDRINGQLGMMFIALAAVDLVMNAWSSLALLRYDKRLLYSFFLIVVLAVSSFGVIYAVSTSAIKPFGFGGEEIYFFIWGFVVSVVDVIIFTKQKSFLG